MRYIFGFFKAIGMEIVGWFIGLICMIVLIGLIAVAGDEGSPYRYFAMLGLGLIAALVLFWFLLIAFAAGGHGTAFNTRMMRYRLLAIVRGFAIFGIIFGSIAFVGQLASFYFAATENRPSDVPLTYPVLSAAFVALCVAISKAIKAIKPEKAEHQKEDPVTSVFE